MKTAISLPDPLFEAAERLAMRQGISRSELFQRALRAYLDACREDRVTERLDRLYGDGSETASVDPVLQELQRASVTPEDW